MGTKICKNCGAEFKILEKEIHFYKTLNLPLPTLCPQDRYKKRLLQRNERNLYKRKCDATGKDIISIHSSDKKTTVYSNDYWWSDKWSPLDYGKKFDFSRPFFEQFAELFKVVPQIQLNNARSQNSEYTNQSQDNKNCYLLVASENSENCYFGMWNQDCKSCCDCLGVEKSELCYEVVNGTNCYRCLYSENIENCSECLFCKNCIGCQNCFGCINLRNKQYYFQNQKLSKEKYFQKISELNLAEYKNANQLKDEFKKFTLQFPHKYYTGHSIQNSTGDYLREVKNTIESFNCRYCEDVAHCYDVWNAKICYDLTETVKNDRCLQLEGCNTTFECVFCMKIDHSYNLNYCSHCYSCNNCFGCVGLRHLDYCILNKKYSKEEYEELKPRIIEKMKKEGEWGEYFPESISQFKYTETVAQDYFPIEVKSEEKAFRLIETEKEFYKKWKIPTPQKSPNERHIARLNRRNPRKLWDRKCNKCGATMRTTYSKDRPEIIYCEKCYLAEVD